MTRQETKNLSNDCLKQTDHEALKLLAIQFQDDEDRSIVTTQTYIWGMLVRNTVIRLRMKGYKHSVLSVLKDQKFWETVFLLGIPIAQRRFRTRGHNRRCS